MNRLILLAVSLWVFITGFTAISDVQQSMLSRFTRFAAIDSQSSYDSICTVGQHNMALAIKNDVDSMIHSSGASGVQSLVSAENYVYVTIPSNTDVECPTLGISCHLDVTPEGPGGAITPITDSLNGHLIVRTDGSTLLGADDKCGCTIALQLIDTLLGNNELKHGEVMFAFCPNEDVGRAADAIDPEIFNPDILFDLDGTEGEVITHSNFTARGFNVKFIGNEAHPSKAKAENLADATAAAATYIAFFPIEVRPENTEGRQGYIHPWSFEKDNADVTVQTRVRYFDLSEGEYFDSLLNQALAKVHQDFPNVGIEIVFDGLQYENVAYTIHPKARYLVDNAANKINKTIIYMDERAGTTASMFAAKGLKGGMCVFTGQHEPHSPREYADFTEMEESYLLMLEIIKEIPSL